ncbi:hypothetical protein Lser_V15G20462 [Lactuca serriola]
MHKHGLAHLDSHNHILAQLPSHSNSLGASSPLNFFLCTCTWSSPSLCTINNGLGKEQNAAIAALIRLLGENPSRGLIAADVEYNTIDILCRVLSSNSSMELNSDAAELRYVLFESTRIRYTVTAGRSVEPLTSLLISECTPAHLSVVRALDRLIDDENLVELVSVHGGIIPLVGLLHRTNYMLHEATSLALVKMGVDILARLKR